MLKAIVLALILSLTGFAQQHENETKAKTAREADLSKSIEKQELRHFELHRFFLPVTQGNLQWLSAQIGARPDEALVVWKLMRDWDADRAARLNQQQDPARNPS
jgi:hypothetical protein